MKAIALALLVATLPAAAQSSPSAVWRCGPDGRQFQATPCAEGRAVALAPAPDAGARAEARAVVERERLALQTLAAQRRDRERQAVAAAGFRPAEAAPVKLRPSRPATAGCGTSPAAARGSPRDPAARECS